MKNRRKLLIWTAVIFIAAGIIFFTGFQFFRTGTVKGELLPLPESAAIGETIPLTAVLQTPAGYRITGTTLILPDGWTAAGRPEVKDSFTFDLSRNWQITAHAVPVEPEKGGPGSLNLKMEDITGRELPDQQLGFELPGAGKAVNDTSEPLPVYTAGKMTEVKEAGTMQILLLIAAVVIAAAATVAAIFIFRRKRAVPAKDFWQETMVQLEEIRGEIPRCRDLNNLLARLSDTVREYLEKRFDLPATRRTTPEFLAMLAQPDAPLQASDKAALQTFLAKTELVKFACVNAERGLLEKAAETAIGIVRDSKPESSEEEEEKKDV